MQVEEVVILEDDILLEEEFDKIETRGKPITCKYCHVNFKIANKKEKEEWKIDNYICPICLEHFCILPPTERELRYLQDKYLLTRTEEDFIPLLRLMYKYTQSLIKKNYSKALKFYGSLDYYSNETITIMVEEYLSKPGFAIGLSFGGFLIHKIRQAIYNPKQFVGQHTSFDFQFEDGNNLHELIADRRKDVIQKIEESEDEIFLHKKIIELIEGVEEYCEDPYEDYIRTISLYAYFNKGEIAFDKIFQAFGRKGKEISMKTLEILRKELCKEMIIYSSENKKEEIKVDTKNNMILNINNLQGINWE